MSTQYYLSIAPETVKGIVEILAVFLMLIGLIAVLWHRVKQSRGLSSISVQFVSIIFVFPTILILSLENVLKGETAATLIGALAGYLFAEFGRPKTVQRPGRGNGDPANEFEMSRPPFN